MADCWADAWCEQQKHNSGFYWHDPAAFDPYGCVFVHACDNERVVEHVGDENELEFPFPWIDIDDEDIII